MALVCTGCSLVSTLDNNITIAPDLKFHLCSPEQLGKSFFASYAIDVTYKGDSHKFLAQAEVDPERAVIAGLTPFGNRIFLLTTVDGKVRYEPSPLFKVPVKPQFVMANLQLIFWPQDVLQNHITQGLLVEDRTGKGLIRKIYCREQECIRIHYSNSSPWRGQIVFEHLQWHYTFVLRTLDIEIDAQHKWEPISDVP